MLWLRHSDVGRAECRAKTTGWDGLNLTVLPWPKTSDQSKRTSIKPLEGGLENFGGLIPWVDDPSLPAELRIQVTGNNNSRAVDPKH